MKHRKRRPSNNRRRQQQQCKRGRRCALGHPSVYVRGGHGTDWIGVGLKCRISHNWGNSHHYRRCFCRGRRRCDCTNGTGIRRGIWGCRTGKWLCGHRRWPSRPVWWRRYGRSRWFCSCHSWRWNVRWRVRVSEKFWQDGDRRWQRFAGRRWHHRFCWRRQWCIVPDGCG